jgi:alkaline phosphatase D
MKSTGPTRRDVFRMAGSTALVLACGDNEPQPDPATTHATALFEPEPNSVLLAMWSSVAREAAIDIEQGGEIVASTATSLASSRAVVDIGGLEPSTAYRVTIVADSGFRVVHQLRTAPRADDPRPVRIAVSADFDPYPEFDSDLCTHLAAASPELFVSLGDFPYTDNGPPAMTVEEYRARHVEARTAPKARVLLQAMGVRAIYDDHEFRNDWDAIFRTVEASRYAAAMQVWDEFFPLRGTTGEVRYRSWRWGANLECFLLDCRRFRSPNPATDDANKTMLGEVQRAWLLDAVKRSTATFKLVFTSVPLDFGDGNDHWRSFTTERAMIFDALAGVPGVLFMSADQHFFAAHRHARGVREFQVGPLARGIATPVVAGAGVLFRSTQFNFGLVDVDATSITVTGVGADGASFYKETLGAADLTPF